MPKKARARSKVRNPLHARSRFSDGVKALLRAQFDELDGDRSGHIDAGEAAALAARHLRPGATAKDKRVLGDALRRALDVNGDGKINFEEYASRFGPRLQMAEARRRRGKQAHPGYQKSQMAGCSQMESDATVLDSRTLDSRTPYRYTPGFCDILAWVIILFWLLK
jgi:hypothetical protein